MASELLIMRHAKSDWDADYRQDFERPLNRRGSKDAKRMGKWLKQEKLIPDAIICSPAVRALSTAELIAAAIRFPAGDIRIIESLYDGGLNAALLATHEAVDKYQRPLLVAHNPTLDALLEYLASQRPGQSASGKLMTTAAIAVLAVNHGIRRGGCKLITLMRPKELA